MPMFMAQFAYTPQAWATSFTRRRIARQLRMITPDEHCPSCTTGCRTADGTCFAFRSASRRRAG